MLLYRNLSCVHEGGGIRVRVVSPTTFTAFFLHVRAFDWGACCCTGAYFVVEVWEGESKVRAANMPLFDMPLFEIVCVMMDAMLKLKVALYLTR